MAASQQVWLFELGPFFENFWARTITADAMVSIGSLFTLLLQKENHINSHFVVLTQLQNHFLQF